MQLHRALHDATTAGAVLSQQVQQEQANFATVDTALQRSLEQVQAAEQRHSVVHQQRTELDIKCAKLEAAKLASMGEVSILQESMEALQSGHTWKLQQLGQAHGTAMESLRAQHKAAWSTSQANLEYLAAVLGLEVERELKSRDEAALETAHSHQQLERKHEQDDHEMRARVRELKAESGQKDVRIAQLEDACKALEGEITVWSDAHQEEVVKLEAALGLAQQARASEEIQRNTEWRVRQSQVEYLVYPHFPPLISPLSGPTSFLS